MPRWIENNYLYYKQYSHKYKFYYEKRYKKQKEIEWERFTNYYYNFYKGLMKQTHPCKVNCI